MGEWIPFEEGEYLVERAIFLGSEGSLVVFEDASIKVFHDQRGRRQMNGRGRLQNILMVKLLDEDDHLDLALDLGGEFKYLLKDPILKGGKVFSPDVKSPLHFSPREPWKKLQEDEFDALWSRLKFVSD